MNMFIISSSLCWIIAMSIIISHMSLLYVKILGTVIILTNIVSVIFYMIRSNNKKMLEFRIYSDNIMVMFLILMFPMYCFYGHFIQILLSIFINHFYLKSKNYIYKILLFLMVTETCIYLSMNKFEMNPQVICNTISSSLLIVFLILLKNKILLNPDIRFKKVVEKTNAIFRHELIETIMPINYYTKDLKDNKQKIDGIVLKLINLTKSKSFNLGQIITLIRASICVTYNLPVNIIFIEKIHRRPIMLDSYILVLIMYSIIDAIIHNQATEITIEHNYNGILIMDNGVGFDVKSKCFTKSKLKMAIDLLELYDMRATCRSTLEVGNNIMIEV